MTLQAVVEHEPRARPEDGGPSEAEAALLGVPLACPDDVTAAEDELRAAALAAGEPQAGASTSRARGKGGRGGRAAGGKGAAATAAVSSPVATASPADTLAPESRAGSEEGQATAPAAVVTEATEVAVVTTAITTEAEPMAVDPGETGAPAGAAATVVAVSVAAGGEASAPAAADTLAQVDKQGSPPLATAAVAMEVVTVGASQETTTTAAGAAGAAAPGLGTSTGTSTNGSPAPPASAGGRTPSLRQGVRATRFQQQQQQQQQQFLQQQQAPPAATSGGKEGTPVAGPPAPTYPPDLTFVRSTRTKLGHAGNNMAARHAVMDAAMAALDTSMGPLVQVRVLLAGVWRQNVSGSTVIPPSPDDQLSRDVAQTCTCPLTC
jgi:hypothetical protein